MNDDWMYDRGFLDINEKPTKQWWQTKPVSSLPISDPVTVSANTTIQSVLDIMHTRSFDQIPVVSNDG